MQRAKLDGVDYGDAGAVQIAREAITHMGLWDTIVDLCDGGAKREALERLADVVLREKAACWQQGGENRVLCEEMAQLDRREVQAGFLEMLSPQGIRAILAKSEETDEGIRFLPDTKTALDDLLSITFPSEEGEQLLRSGDVADAWQFARTHELDAEKWSKAAQDLQSNGSHPLAAKAWKRAALHFSYANKDRKAAEAYEQAASDLTVHGLDRTPDDQRLAAADALGAAAEIWHQVGRHDIAETRRSKQAEYLTTLGMLDEAAFCTKMQRNLHETKSAVHRLPPEMLHLIASYFQRVHNCRRSRQPARTGIVR